MRSCLRLSLLTILFIVSGCKRGPDAQSFTPATQHGTKLAGTTRDQPLSRDEIEAFLQTLHRFPGHQAPFFTENQLPRLTSARQLNADIAKLREAIRNAVTPEQQAADWMQEPELRRVFEELNVDPQHFANLMLRISCAWSAWAIRQETSLAKADSQLNFRMVQLVDQLHNPGMLEGSIEQQELLQTLEEMIGLAEFLKLITEVPAESLRAVADARAELQTVLPESTLAKEFARLVETQTTILQTGFAPGAVAK